MKKCLITMDCWKSVKKKTILVSFLNFWLTPEKEERFIENTEKLVDILANWELEKILQKKDIPDFKIYLRVRIYWDVDDKDIDNIVMFYTQAQTIFSANYCFF